METRIIDESMKLQWQEYLESNPYAIAWQGYEWHNVLRKHYSFEFFPIAAFNSNVITGVLPLYKVSTLFEKNILISVPYAVAGGIVADDGPTRSAILEHAVNLSKELQCRKIALKQYKVRVEADLTTDDHFYNRELSLSEDTSLLWEQINESNRAAVEEADKHELRLEYPSDKIDEFYQVLLKHHHRQGIPCVSKKWIHSLVSSGMYNIALLYKGGTIVSCTAVKAYKRTVSLPFTCLPDGKPEQELYAYSLYWRLIKKFARDQYEIFHSGRIPNNDQTNAYRLGWGGVRHGYFYQYYPNVGARTEYSTKKGRKREIFESVWQKMPQSAINAIGPHIVKHFP